MTNLIEKNIRFGDKDFLVSGYGDDAYFQHAESNISSNDLFAAVLVHHVSSGSTIIDVGANIGITTALASAFVKDAFIVSIEPSHAFDGLINTCKANKIQRQRSFDCCIGAADGKSAFVSAASDSSASHIGHPGAPEIEMRSLDSLALEMGLTRCDFVKIDVEGFEGGVLDGMTRINSEFQPLIFMEFNSYCLTAFSNISPRAFAERIVAEFGCFLVRKNESTDLEIVRISDIIPFIHRNMTSRGCVDDIIFSKNNARISAFMLD